ncbi:MAG: phosphomannomutase [Lentisphaeria bacterium]|nr:phosphomannomutase [Lentisphaeria bacterium]
MSLPVKKVLGFDLDGTLTQHKSPLGPENRRVLEQLAGRYRLLMIGAGGCRRIYDQLGGFPIEIIGNYGLQHSLIRNGAFTIVEDRVCPVDRDEVERRAAELRRKLRLEKFTGDTMEFHASGVLTFPILGTGAGLGDKLAYDPDRRKRRAMYAEVCAAFAGYHVFLGGSSSFDIAPAGYDKYRALLKFCGENGVSPAEILYTGDDFGPGGNDAPVRQGGIDCVEIDDYRTLPSKLAFLLR